MAFDDVSSNGVCVAKALCQFSVKPIETDRRKETDRETEREGERETNELMMEGRADLFVGE